MTAEQSSTDDGLKLETIAGSQTVAENPVSHSLSLHAPERDWPEQSDSGQSSAPSDATDFFEARNNLDDDLPAEVANLNELAAPSPVDNPDEREWYHHEDLESQRRSPSFAASNRSRRRSGPTSPWHHPTKREDAGKVAQTADTRRRGRSHRRRRMIAEALIVAYLTFFSMMGTLSRLGVEWLTFYPGTPSCFPVLWANFGGSLVLGYLLEDRRLFQHLARSRVAGSGEGGNSSEQREERLSNEERKTVPLYIGLATGFCGSFTSFSSWMGDIFAALTNSLRTPFYHPEMAGYEASIYSTAYRNAGYSVLAVLSITIITICLGLSALKLGAHAAIAFDSVNLHLSSRTHRALDIAIGPIALGCWIGAILMTVWPVSNDWRQKALFAIIFAPPGCLLRFYASLKLNAVYPAFPLGTFSVNVFGTMVYGMSYDLQHVAADLSGGFLGCQVWQGMMDGFCGALTTVSTFCAEIESLKRRHAYTYGATSWFGGFALLLIIMGTLHWTVGFQSPMCIQS